LAHHQLNAMKCRIGPSQGVNGPTPYLNLSNMQSTLSDRLS
jgi:hypothetical protein